MSEPKRQRVRGMFCRTCNKEVSITVDAEDAVPLVDRWLDEAKEEHGASCPGFVERFDTKGEEGVTE